MNISPNPIVSSFSISYTIPVAGNLLLRLLSADGRIVRTLNQGYCPAGNYTLTVNTAEFAAGVYFIQVQTNHYRTTRKIVKIE